MVYITFKEQRSCALLFTDVKRSVNLFLLVFHVHARLGKFSHFARKFPVKFTRKFSRFSRFLRENFTFFKNRPKEREFPVNFHVFREKFSRFSHFLPVNFRVNFSRFPLFPREHFHVLLQMNDLCGSAMHAFF